MTFPPPLFYVKMLVSMSNCVGVAGRRSRYGYSARWSSSHKRLNGTIDTMPTDIFFKTLTLLLDHVPAFFLFSFYEIIFINFDAVCSLLLRGLGGTVLCFQEKGAEEKRNSG